MRIVDLLQFIDADGQEVHDPEHPRQVPVLEALPLQSPRDLVRVVGQEETHAPLVADDSPLFQVVVGTRDGVGIHLARLGGLPDARDALPGSPRPGEDALAHEIRDLQVDCLVVPELHAYTSASPSRKYAAAQLAGARAMKRASAAILKAMAPWYPRPPGLNTSCSPLPFRSNAHPPSLMPWPGPRAKCEASP